MLDMKDMDFCIPVRHYTQSMTIKAQTQQFTKLWEPQFTYFECRRGGGTDPGQAATAAAVWVWLCAWWDSLAPACFGSLGGTGSQGPVSQSGLISQMQGIHSLYREKKEEGEGEMAGVSEEKEKATE